MSQFQELSFPVLGILDAVQACPPKLEVDNAELPARHRVNLYANIADALGS